MTWRQRAVWNQALGMHKKDCRVLDKSFGELRYWQCGVDPGTALNNTALVRIGARNRSGFKAVGSGVSEWRIDWGPGIRIYLAHDGTKLIILLGGGTKARQQADIEEALLRWTDHKRRKAERE